MGTSGRLYNLKYRMDKMIYTERTYKQQTGGGRR